MEREVFKSKPLRGLPAGLIRGFLFGCICLFIGLAMGMDEDIFIPLLGVIVVLGGITGIIGSTGKRIEADENGVYLKKKEYLFAENDMYMYVHTHYYSAVPVTERYIKLNGKREIKCSFISGQDAGRLSKIIEDAMRKKHHVGYKDFELNDASVRTFTVPAAILTEQLDKRAKLLLNIMFWMLTILFSWVLISMIIQDELEEYGLIFLIAVAMNVLIFGSVNFFLCRNFKKSAQLTPQEVIFALGRCYIDGKSFGRMDVSRVVMTPVQGYAKGNMRRLVFYSEDGSKCEYCFGFRGDMRTYPEYGQLTEAVKETFGDKFAYDLN